MTKHTPESILAKPFFHKPFFVPPSTDTFAKRAKRLNELAQEQTDLSWQAYLNLLATLAQVQNQHLAQQHIPPTLPSALPRDPLWLSPQFIAQLPTFCQALLSQAALPETARQQLTELIQLSPEQRQALLNEESPNLWVQALIQVLWTAWTSQLTEDNIPSTETRSHCPCCGEEAIASIILSGGDNDNLRYLHCPRCNSRWNALRAKCTFCDQQSSIQLHQISPEETQALPSALQAARAESCDCCKHYRKMFFLRDQPNADPIADDLASLALDILIGEKDYSRGGYNHFLPITTK